jgi:tetratricopeptide (TPR) repeat protein
MGDTDRAEKEIRRSIAEARALAAVRSENPLVTGNLAIALFKFGEFLHSRKRANEAEPFFSEAISLAEPQWSESSPSRTNSAYGWILAESHAHLAVLKSDGQRTEEIERHFKSALKYQEPMAGQQDSVYSTARLGGFLSDYANFLVKSGRYDEAEQYAGRAIILTKKAIERERRNAAWTSNLVNHYAVLARIAEARNLPAELIDARKLQIATLERLVADFPERAAYNCRTLNQTYHSLGVTLLKLQHQAEALAWFAKVPEEPAYAESVRARAMIRLMALDRELHDAPEGLRLSTWGTQKFPESGSWLILQAYAQHRTGDSKTALATLERAWKAPGEGELDLAFVHAMILHKSGEREKARATCAGAMEVMNQSKKDSEDVMLRVLRREALAELGLTEADFEKPKPMN